LLIRILSLAGGRPDMKPRGRDRSRARRGARPGRPPHAGQPSADERESRGPPGPIFGPEPAPGLYSAPGPARRSAGWCLLRVSGEAGRVSPFQGPVLRWRKFSQLVDGADDSLGRTPPNAARPRIPRVGGPRFGRVRNFTRRDRAGGSLWFRETEGDTFPSVPPGTERTDRRMPASGGTRPRRAESARRTGCACRLREEAAVNPPPYGNAWLASSRKAGARREFGAGGGADGGTSEEPSDGLWSAGSRARVGERSGRLPQGGAGPAEGCIASARGAREN